MEVGNGSEAQHRAPSRRRCFERSPAHVSRDSASLKRSVAQARLVVVHSQEIDNAGEKGVGPAVFDHVMQKLRAAWRLLRDAGVRREARCCVVLQQSLESPALPLLKSPGIHPHKAVVAQKPDSRRQK